MGIRVKKCEVRLQRLPNGKFNILVRVQSNKKEALNADTDIDPGNYGNQAELLRAVGAAGAACAEHLNEKYHDNFSVEHYAQFAQRAFLEEIKLTAELAKEAPAKIKRLRSIDPILFQSIYVEWQQEFVEELEAAIKRGDQPTPEDNAVLDQMVGILHQEDQEQ